MVPNARWIGSANDAEEVRILHVTYQSGWLCLQRRSQIEAINGAWAMIGLTAGLVIEGQTGKGILAQVNLLWLQVCSHVCGSLSHTLGERFEFG